MRELLSNNSLFVGQLYEEKSLALHARDLIFFTTDQELIYFLNKRSTYINSLSHVENFVCQLFFCQTCIWYSLLYFDPGI